MQQTRLYLTCQEVPLSQPLPQLHPIAQILQLLLQPPPQLSEMLLEPSRLPRLTKLQIPLIQQLQMTLHHQVKLQFSRKVPFGEIPKKLKALRNHIADAPTLPLKRESQFATPVVEIQIKFVQLTSDATHAEAATKINALANQTTSIVT